MKKRLSKQATDLLKRVKECLKLHLTTPAELKAGKELVNSELCFYSGDVEHISAYRDYHDGDRA